MIEGQNIDSQGDKLKQESDHIRVALVTGGGSGIGRAAALALAQDGFQTVVTGRRPEALAETAALASTDTIVPIQADISDPQSVDVLFTKIENRFERLDVLFNNAGIGTPPVLLDTVKVEDWLSCVSVNLTGAFLCARQAFGMMRRQTPQGGRIINNGSVSATSPRPGSAAYTATKHAITGLTKSISLDGRDFSIACSQIDIGNADTALAAKFKTGVPQASGDIRPEPVFDVNSCGEAIAYMARLPLSTNIQFMTIMATNMPFIGRG